jgi:DNA repair protein RadC
MNLTHQVRSEPAVRYRAKRLPLDEEEAVVRQAMALLARRMKRPGNVLTSPQDARDYLRLRLEKMECEVFGVIWLDCRSRVLVCEELFRGTIDGASIHARELVKDACRYNAASAILYHNHPSGDATPSTADMRITQRIKDALALIDCRVMDHLIIGAGETSSMAERGIL